MLSSATAALNGAAAKPKAAAAGKSRAAAEDFEAVFLNSMFQQMFTEVGKGSFSGGPAAGVWRSFLTDEYSKMFAKSGGIGLADHVQRALLAQQEIR
jgi:Rod binding domain-containing protein